MIQPNSPPPLTITRVFAAPRALVFRAWTSAEHLKAWFSPEGCSVPEADIDFRPGGIFNLCMRLPDGQDFWTKGHYAEIVEPERLVLDLACVVDDKPRFNAHTTVIFTTEGAGTRLTVNQVYTIFDDDFHFAVSGAPEGWRTTLDKLEQEVARIVFATGSQVEHATFSLDRVYPATPAQVFRAFTDQEAKARWFSGGDDYTILERAMDIRPGGRERLKGRWGHGGTACFDAVYFDVVADHRLVYAYEMHLDDRRISVSLATVTLHPEGDGTKLIITEQGAFLDGYADDGSRARGTAHLLDRLGQSLSTQT